MNAPSSGIRTTSKLSIIGPAISNLPWQPRPTDIEDLVWRYDRNPVIGRRLLSCVTGIYHSAVVRFAPANSHS